MKNYFAGLVLNFYHIFILNLQFSSSSFSSFLCAFLIFHFNSSFFEAMNF